jgi:hypothetical protein
MDPLPSNPPTIEESFTTLVDDVKHKAHLRYEKCEDRVRRSPAKALIIATAVGYCLHRLPVRSILATQVRLLGALAPPALFAFGTAKIFEYLQRNARETRPKHDIPRHGSE